MSEEIDHDRRRHLGTAALTIAAAELGFIGSADAQSSDQPDQAGNEHVVRSLKQIDAGVLNVGYAEAGPANGPPVILLHGWPYDIYSFVDVAPLLASAGYRVIVPTCAATARRVFFRMTRSVTRSKRRSHWTSSR
jgi:hypothetical protein